MGNLEVGFMYKRKKELALFLVDSLFLTFFLLVIMLSFFFMIPTFFLGRKRVFLHFFKKLSFIKSYPRTFI